MRPYSFSKPKIRRLRGLGCNMRSTNRIAASPAFFNRRTRSAAAVYLVGLVYPGLSCGLIREGKQPNK